MLVPAQAELPVGLLFVLDAAAQDELNDLGLGGGPHLGNRDPVLEVAIKPLNLLWQFFIVLILSIASAIGPVSSIGRFNFVSIIRGRE